MSDLTPETLAELRRAALIEGHDAAHYPTSVVVPTRTLLALLDAAAERDALAAKLDAAIDVAHLDRQQAWSAETFGPAEVRGHRGVLDHIRKELVAGDLWFRIRGDMWFDGDVRIGSEGLGRYGPITPVLDADGLPVVHTVGDLTARHLRRDISVEGMRTATLLAMRIPPRNQPLPLVAFLVRIDGTIGTTDYYPLDTPCEVLP